MVDTISTMKEVTANTRTALSDRIAQRVRDLRAARGMSLDVLAAHCGVSRSMISLIERGECSPTAVVLEKLATGLNATLATLFDAPQSTNDPVARLGNQLTWRDPHSGYVRRNVSPIFATSIGGSNVNSPIQIVEVAFPAKARVAYETGAREPQVHQQVWVLEGSIHVSVGDEQHRLKFGDCLALVLDRPVSFHNPTRTVARYAVVITTLPFSGR
jgi:transcriptional regulator with XRE-family HTH domain